MNNFSTELLTENFSEPILKSEIALLKGKKDIPIRDETYVNYTDYFKTLLAPDKTKLAQSYRSTYYVCGNLNAAAVASVPWHLYVQTGKNDNKPRVKTKSLSSKQYKQIEKSNYGIKKSVEIQEVEDHPFLDLMETLNSYQLLEELQLFQEILGDAYLYIQTGSFGEISNIQIIPAQFMFAERDVNGTIFRWRYTSGAMINYFKPEEIVHFQGPSLTPYTRGFSPAEASYEEFNLLNALRSFEYNLIRNGGAPGTILTPSEDIGEDEAKRTEARFDKKYRKGGMGGLFVACPGDKVERLGLAPSEVEALALQAITTKDIGNAFGIPGPLLNSALAPRAQLEAAYYQHSVQAIAPRIKRLEAKFNQEIISKYDPRLFIMFDNPIPIDQQTQSVIFTSYKNAGILTVDEIREELGYDPLPEPTPVVQPTQPVQPVDNTQNIQGDTNAPAK